MEHQKAKPNGAIRTQIAVARIGKTYIGIDATYVAHATNVPEPGIALPRRSGALVGVVEYSDQTVPVVDLRRWVSLGEYDASGGAQRVIILQASSRFAGLVVDEILGLNTVDITKISKLIHDDRNDEVFHSVVRTDDFQHLLNLLDCDRLMELAATWVKTDSTDTVTSNAKGSVDEIHSTVATVSYALFEVGPAIIAVEATAVAEVLPMPALHTFESQNVHGLCDWRGRKVVILSPTTIIGQQEDAELPLVAIFTYNGLSLGIPVQRATRLARAPELSKSVGLSDFVSAYYNEDREKLHVVDIEKLFQAFPEASISKLEGIDVSFQRTEKSRSLNSIGFIAYEADGYAAMPLSVVEEILPGSILKAEDVGSGVMHWRERSLRIIDLRPKNTAVVDDVTTAGHLIVTRRANDIVSFLVSRVSTLIPAGSGDVFKMRLAGAKFNEVITTGNSGDNVSYVVIDPELFS